MSDSHTPSNARAAWDALLVDIVDYVRDFQPVSDLAWRSARLVLIDSLTLADLVGPTWARGHRDQVRQPQLPGLRLRHSSGP